MMPAIANHILQEMAVQVSNEAVKQEFLMPQTPALPKGWPGSKVLKDKPMWGPISQWVKHSLMKLSGFSRLSLDTPERTRRGNIHAVFGEATWG